MQKLPLIAALILVLSLYAPAQSAVRVNTAAPVFEAQSLTGETFGLAQSREKVVLMTFWSTRCAICHEEVPKMNRIADQYHGKDVVFLAFTNEPESRVNPYLAKNPFKFNIMPNSFGTLLAYADKDKNGNINMPYPSYFLIDRSGRVALKTSGFDKTPQIAAEISRLLGDRAK